MSVFLLEGAVTHAARGCDGRQEGRASHGDRSVVRFKERDYLLLLYF